MSVVFLVVSTGVAVSFVMSFCKSWASTSGIVGIGSMVGVVNVDADVYVVCNWVSGTILSCMSCSVFR